MEKPEYDFLVNTGMYVLGSTLLEITGAGKYLEMTNLIALVQRRQGRVGVFPIRGTAWVDVGEW